MPRQASSDGSDACDFASAYGLTADPWQADVLGGWLGRRSDGKWASARCGLAVPRQNGKNAILEVRELFGMVALGEKILHTAHEVKTARKAFLRLLSFFENERLYPELAELVAPSGIRKTNGQEAIVLKNGGSVEFVARSKGSGRGFTVDVLVCDEAQELTDDQLAALLPTISAAPTKNPQLIVTGTPPAPSMNGEVFTRTRKAGVKGEDTRLCWHEWSVADALSRLDDVAARAEANPAAGRRLSFETMADERAAMEDETFARERLGMWAEDDDGAVITSAVWAACGDPGSEIVGAATFALDVSPDRSMSALAVAGARSDSLAHVEVTSSDGVVDHRAGTDWIVPRLKDMATRNPGLTVLVAANSAAASLVPALEQAGLLVLVIPTGDVASACGLFFDSVTAAELRHRGDPALAAALKAARKNTEDGETAWRWGRKKSAGDITALYAVTLALWGHVKGLSAAPNCW